MQIVEVRLKFDSRLYPLFNSKFDLKKGDYVVCESAVGESYGQVDSVKDFHGKLPDDAKNILRIANEADAKHYEEVAQKSREAVKITEEIVKRHGLEMNVVNAEYSFDLSKVVIDFIAEDRVDFRDLIKELVATLKTRIELKQIGIREQAKIVGGIGICGRPCCCSSYLKDFEKVSIKMAKVQGLALNPQKISGACGRLMCCLSYENEFYSNMSKSMPKVNSEVETKDGKGTVVYQNMLKETVSVKFVDNDGTTSIKDYNLKDIKFKSQNKPTTEIVQNPVKDEDVTKKQTQNQDISKKDKKLSKDLAKNDRFSNKKEEKYAKNPIKSQENDTKPTKNDKKVNFKHKKTNGKKFHSNKPNKE